MPIYEYQCTKCGHITERLCNSNFMETIHCEKCDAPADRIMSLSSFRLIGDGWYKPSKKEK